jgi:Thioesterase-like superfamily
MSAVDAFFTADGDSYVPGHWTRGPWGQTMGGQVVGGLLGWALDSHGDAAFQPARLTVDLLRPVLIEPVSISTAVLREGRRIKLVDGELLQSGRVVARASALFLRRGGEPDGEVWSAPVRMPTAPVDSDGRESETPFSIWTYSAASDTGTLGISGPEWEQAGAQKFAWTRLFRPMVAGHPLTPFTRAAFAGDIISSLTHWGTGGLRYINADYTVAVSRLPEGEYIGLAAQSHYGNDGVATGSATLFDHLGAIGTGTALAIAQSAEAFQPTYS